MTKTNLVCIILTKISKRKEIQVKIISFSLCDISLCKLARVSDIAKQKGMVVVIDGDKKEARLEKEELEADR